ncbi:MAG TPA: MBL fold metallo-hydrolase [Gemmatimonadaceae bacterium]|nr:MBL fold metallo-hydrolase [Gemmatimonadaceae bacterium]
MRMWVLGSGSRGNAVLLECGESRVLIDAGFAAGTIAKRMRSIGVAPESIEGVVITHEHTDHMKGAAVGARRFGWTLHATKGTVEACDDLVEAKARTFDAGATLHFTWLDLATVRTSHDANDPIAVVATARASGARIGIVYDLGCGTPQVQRALSRLDVLLLESNHDEGMLRTGPYPWYLQQRIASRTGHLSNRAAGELATQCTHRGLGDVVLAHLSEINNDPKLATRAMTSTLKKTTFRGRVTASAQREVVGPFGAGMSSQLALF